ncbi:hypothetical protein M426DRAFT_324451 [Hypoxylon sp. CI-4A]|nr:hypothetical protein M426DRAFT_324451 [Hypoxylon sp. CI-4A]
MAIGLEIAVFGAAAASRAAELGASRVELNALGSYYAGGLTPSLEDLQAISHLQIPVRIMIRPRGPPPGEFERDFIYSDEEFWQMEADIHKFKESGLLNQARGDGFVFGILRENAQSHDELSARKPSVDKDRCARLVAAARPFSAVFHRAFDEIASNNYRESNVDTGLEDLAACGFNALLTSGGVGNAIRNLDMLDKIIARAGTLGIEIIVGGGIRKTTVEEISLRLGLKERTEPVYVHSACLLAADAEYPDPDEVTTILARLG